MNVLINLRETSTKKLARIAAISNILFCCFVVSSCKDTTKVEFCDVSSNPKRFYGKLLDFEVAARFNFKRGFELKDVIIGDEKCPAKCDIIDLGNSKIPIQTQKLLENKIKQEKIAQNTDFSNGTLQLHGYIDFTNTIKNNRLHLVIKDVRSFLITDSKNPPKICNLD